MKPIFFIWKQIIQVFAGRRLKYYSGGDALSTTSRGASSTTICEGDATSTTLIVHDATSTTPYF